MEEQLEKIRFIYEISTEMLMPKSYQWKTVAEKMYQIAKQNIEPKPDSNQ